MYYHTVHNPFAKNEKFIYTQCITMLKDTRIHKHGIGRATARFIIGFSPKFPTKNLKKL